MKTKIFRMLCIALCVNMLACQKNDDVATTSGSNPVKDFFATLKRPAETFTINAQSGGQFTTTAGSQFNFNANSFIDENGNVVTGSITVTVNDFLSKRDLIFNSVSTVSGGKPIVSGGSYKISVSQGSKKLSMAPGKNYSVLMPTTYYDVQQMSVYNGVEISNGQFGSIDWIMASNSATSYNFAMWDSMSLSNYLRTNGLNWVNCDHPTDSDFAPIVIHSNDDVTISGSIIVTCPGRFIVCQPSFNRETGNANWDYAIMNENFKACLVYSKNNKFYYSESSFFFTGQNITLPPATEVSETVLEQKLNSL